MRQIFLILFLLFSILAYGQENNSVDIRINSGQITNPPLMIIKMDSIDYHLDSVTQSQINPRMIKKIEVLKSEKDKNLYGNQNGIVLIYPKKRFERKILHLLASSNNLILNTKIDKRLRNEDFIIKTGIGFDNYKIDTTCLLKVIADFGNSYDLVRHEKSSMFELKYNKIGLSFYFYEMKGNALLDCIVFNRPFRGSTDTGINLGVSTMIDVKKAYGELDWYTTKTADYWWSEYPGIEFGVEREIDLPRYPLAEELHEMKKIVEIIILNIDEY